MYVEEIRRVESAQSRHRRVRVKESHHVLELFGCLVSGGIRKF